MDKDKNKSAVDEFLGNLEAKQDEGSFQDNTQDSFGQAIELKAEEVKEEKPLPFHKDPKVMKFIEKEINERMTKFKPSETEKENKQENDEVVDALVAVIGNDTPEKMRAVQALRDRLDAGTRKITEWENQQKQKEKDDEEAEKELETAFENIETNYDVDFSTTIGKKIKQEFASYALKLAPKDKDGEIITYPDMNATWEEFQEKKKSTQAPNRAKELAARGMNRSAETSGQTSKKANSSAFESTDNFIESLGK